MVERIHDQTTTTAKKRIYYSIYFNAFSSPNNYTLIMKYFDSWTICNKEHCRLYNAYDPCMQVECPSVTYMDRRNLGTVIALTEEATMQNLWCEFIPFFFCLRVVLRQSDIWHANKMRQECYVNLFIFLQWFVYTLQLNFHAVCHSRIERHVYI